MTVERITQLPALPRRPTDAHKGTFGRALIIAGSRGMSGAACLAGLGALRGGAGLVYVAVPASILPIVAAVEPSYLTIPLPEDAGGRMTRAARSRLEEAIRGSSAIAFGPGWGQTDDLADLGGWLYREATRAAVVDADGLNALAVAPQALAEHAGPRILTPHPGEFARLIGTSTAEIQSRREDAAAELAARYDVVVVLKGAGTVISDGRRLAVNTTGNAGMATGGTGDVLTGLIVALLAQGMEPFAAAQLAAHLHGLAGDLAAAELSQPGLIASDLPRYLTRAWLTLEHHHRSS